MNPRRLILAVVACLSALVFLAASTAQVASFKPGSCAGIWHVTKVPGHTDKHGNQLPDY